MFGLVVQLLRPVRERKERVMRERVEGEGEPQRSWLTGEVLLLLQISVRGVGFELLRALSPLGRLVYGRLFCARETENEMKIQAFTKDKNRPRVSTPDSTCTRR